MSILETSAFRVGLPDSPEGRFSVDVMRLAGLETALKETASAYLRIFRDEGLQDVRRILGISSAGETFGAILAYSEKKPMLWLRDLRTPSQRRITGVVQPGDSILLVDGLYNSETLLKAARIIEAEGGLVTDALVLIAGIGVPSDHIKTHFLLRLSEVVDYMHSKSSC
jgi:adenine/guanine phosphoribosyltransferase-like PRPP-binding protein